MQPVTCIHGIVASCRLFIFLGLGASTTVAGIAEQGTPDQAHTAIELEVAARVQQMPNPPPSSYQLCRMSPRALPLNVARS
jgi:hypothetical protein